MTIPALLASALIALWAFGFRAILLAIIMRHRFGGRYGVLGFSLGLVITPLLAATAAVTGNSFVFLFGMLVACDLTLAGLWINNLRNPRLYTFSLRSSDFGILAYGALCALLTIYNGPFIEQVTDGWWHMRNVAELLAAGTFNVGQSSSPGSLTPGYISALLGLDSSSYRIQAMVAWLTGFSVLKTWYASTAAMAGLLGISFYVLCFQVLQRRSARIIALLFWLLILGGMSTGFRLSGWPAGPGYVFLNLGLVGALWLWLDNRITASTASMLVVTACGMAFYHLAELYLFALAVGFIAVAWIVKTSQSTFAAILWPLVALSGLWLLSILGKDAPVPIAVSVVVPLVIMIACVWGSALVCKVLPSMQAVPICILFAIVFVWIGIDVAHLVELFVPVTPENPGYYNAYIPKFMAGIGNGLLAIPKWEHQLRASILWSGAFSICLSVWLALRRRDQISYWLLALNAGPAIMLLSPPLFSLMTMSVPVYGGYRVQYLIPVALTLALSFTTAVETIGGSQLRTSLPSRVVSTVVLFLSVIAVLPDAAVRTGIVKDRPWAILSNVGFHWRLVDNRESLKTHTSWNYMDDISAISDIVVDSPGMIVSDLATSYYLGAELGTKPLVQHPHHSTSGNVLNQKLLTFCDPRVPEGDLKEYISIRNRELSQRQRPQISYIVINRDQDNYSAEIHGRSCVGETDHLDSVLSRFAEPVYSGQYLTLWRLADVMTK